MKQNYEQTLKNLAETLVTPARYGAVALQEAVVLEFPGGARLKNPPELGWEPPEGTPEAA